MGRIVKAPRVLRMLEDRKASRRVKARYPGIVVSKPVTLKHAFKVSQTAAQKLSVTAVAATVTDTGRLRTPLNLHPTPVKTSTKKASKLDETILQTISDIPFEAGAFRLIRCDRKKATAIQQHVYGLNKDNAAGRHYATRFSSDLGGLLVWRMDALKHY